MLIEFDDSEHEILNNVLDLLEVENMRQEPVRNAYQQVLSYKGIEIDCQYQRVVLENEEVKLTYSEFEILYLLAKTPGRVFTKGQIYSNVWGEPCIGDCSVIMSHIQNIRKKIEKKPGKPHYIQTVWGVGYRFNPHVSSDL